MSSAFSVGVFRTYLATAFVSNAGGWMQVGAIPLVMYQLTGSATWVGIAGFAAFFPTMIGTLPGGYLADRFSRRRQLIISQMMLTVVTGLLALVAATNNLTPTNLAGLVALQALIIGVSIPSWQAFVPTLVSSEKLASAINYNSGQAQLARAIGPGIAGLVLAQFGATWAFAANAVTFGIVAVVLVALRVPEVQAIHQSIATHLRLGWQHSVHTPAVRIAIILVAICMLLGGPAYQLLAILTTDVMQIGAGAYGLLLAMFGVGAVSGNIALSRLQAAPSKLLPVAISIYGASIVTTAVAGGFAIAVAGLCLMGFSYVIITVTLLTRVQMLVPGELKGRVIAIYSFAMLAGTPIGSLTQGWLGERIGIAPVLITAGVALIVVAYVLTVRPSLLTALDPVEHEEPYLDLVTIEEMAEASDLQN